MPDWFPVLRELHLNTAALVKQSSTDAAICEAYTSVFGMTNLNRCEARAVKDLQIPVPRHSRLPKTNVRRGHRGEDHLPQAPILRDMQSDSFTSKNREVDVRAASALHLCDRICRKALLRRMRSRCSKRRRRRAPCPAAILAFAASSTYTTIKVKGICYGH
ncbi:hypothetical protein PMIN05_003854 [Paraphaeosphaeria minitans]